MRVQRVQDLREQHPVQHAGGTLLGCGLQQAVGLLQLSVAGQQTRQYRQRLHGVATQRGDGLCMQADLGLGQFLTELVPELPRGVCIGQGRTVGHHRIGVRCAFLA